MTIDQLPPGLILILGAVLVPFLRGNVRAIYMLLLPALCGWQVWHLTPGEYGVVSLFYYTLVALRVDKLSLVFAYVFTLAAFLAVIYSLHVRDVVQQVAGLGYAGAAICAVFAGDLITLFVFWELTAITSVFLVWATRTERSFRSGMRYLVVQVGSGVLLLSGALVIVNQTGSLTFGHIGIDSIGGQLILLSFGIKAAFPLLNNWLQDAYPEATVTGTVFLSAFTTKLAIYALARGFAGTDMLIWIGAIMAVFPLFYAAIENDLRRALAYILNHQLGFMVVGVGIGTELALNGVAAHAFAHVLYEGMMFMVLGAVLYRAGTAQGSVLGGLYKSMPWTTVFWIVGAASIAGVPLFIGFTTKSMILTAASLEGHWIAWTALVFASVGVFFLAGIKIPYTAFFGPASGKQVREAPVNMWLAMALSSVLCIWIGIDPSRLYAVLPFPVDYVPYTGAHVINQLQLLAFTALGAVILFRCGVYPKSEPGQNLDSDWVYRRLLPAAAHGLVDSLAQARDEVWRWRDRVFDFILERVFHYHGPRGIMARTWAISGAALWVMVLLGGYLLVYYL